MRDRFYFKLTLVLVFLFALAMGAGPGILLIDQTGFILGLPVLFVWAAFWCAVESGVVLAAFLVLWPREPETK